MSLFPEHRVVVRGGGDLATGVVARLHRAGFLVAVLELEYPLAIRRSVSVARAVSDGTARIEDLTAQLVDTPSAAVNVVAAGVIPVLVDEGIPSFPDPFSVLVDARMAKRSLDTTIDLAPLVIGLGPGFEAGVDCHAVVETMRGHHLGRVLWEGAPALNTGVPGMIGGRSEARVIRAPREGAITWTVEIGEQVVAGQTIGSVAGDKLSAGLTGVVRGLIDPIQPATAGLKIADIDPRNDRAVCFEISDKALAVGGGVLEAILTWLNRGRTQ